MSGQFSNSTMSSHNNDAAITGSDAFLEPEIFSSPLSSFPSFDYVSIIHFLHLIT